MNIILASNSPRRRELLSGLGLQYEVRTLPGLDESYPDGLPMEEIPQYISREKAAAYTIGADELLITADTIVWLDGEVLGKPADEAEARRMLRKLSGKTHQVVTGVTLTTSSAQHSFASVSQVTWIGYIGVTAIEGSYFNVMGLPVQRLYTELKRLNYI